MSNPLFAFCPLCGKLIRLTKNGRFYRHGSKRVRQKTWSGFMLERFIELKESCSESGNKYKEIEL